MSTLQVANIHLESTGNNRIQYTGSNGFVFIAGGSNAMVVNTTNIQISSTLQVANIHLESTGNNRIQYNGSNTFAFVIAGSNAMVVNTTNIQISSNLNITPNSITVGNSTVNTVANSTTFAINGNNISPVQSFRNKIINGNFDYWQRGTTGTSGYVADRWRTNVNGSTASISRQSFTLGQTDVPNEPSYFHRVVVTSSASAGNYCLLGQRIESVRTLAGQTATLSFWAKADTSKNIAVEFVQVFGSGGSPSTAVTEIGVTTCALTTSWQKFEITVDVPSISGKTLGTDNNVYLGLNFWFDAGSNFNSRTNSLGQQSGTFDIAQVQLEAGSVATPFEMRPLGMELALCQRYYETGGFHIFCSDVTSGSQYFDLNRFSVIKRDIPTITTTDVSNYGFPAGNPLVAGSTSVDQFKPYKTANATISGGYFQYIWTASAEL